MLTPTKIDANWPSGRYHYSALIVDVSALFWSDSYHWSAIQLLILVHDYQNIWALALAFINIINKIVYETPVIYYNAKFDFCWKVNNNNVLLNKTGFTEYFLLVVLSAGIWGSVSMRQISFQNMRHSYDIRYVLEKCYRKSTIEYLKNSRFH